VEDVGAEDLDKEIRELEARVRTSTDIDAELLPESCAVAGTERRNTRMCPYLGVNPSIRSVWLGIPVKPITCSGANRSPVPAQIDHPFR